MDFNHRLDKALGDYKKKCKCGHTKVVPYSTKYEYLICNWCGGRLYFDDAKQKEYDNKVAKNEFMFKLNKCLDQSKEDTNKAMRKSRVIDKKKLKRRYFNNNAEYFNFCKNMTIQVYIVDTTSKSGKIVVYYGARLGRPPKNKKKITPEEYNKRTKYYGNNYNK